MNETYQNRITDQICKIQNDRALIAFYDRLRYAPLGNYAQLHAKGEYQENGHKVHSLICITIQDYSNGTGDRNIITSLNGARARSTAIPIRTVIPQPRCFISPDIPMIPKGSL